MNAHGTFRMERYSLEPGDATKYNFFIAECDTYVSREGSLTNLWGGVSTEDFVIIGICMANIQGVYPTHRRSLNPLYAHHVGYMASHMNHADFYTVAAVLLAASVLVDSPYDLEDAAKKMLLAQELTKEWNR